MASEVRVASGAAGVPRICGSSWHSTNLQHPGVGDEFRSAAGVPRICSGCHLFALAVCAVLAWRQPESTPGAAAAQQAQGRAVQPLTTRRAARAEAPLSVCTVSEAAWLLLRFWQALLHGNGALG